MQIRIEFAYLFFVVTAFIYHEAVAKNEVILRWFSTQKLNYLFTKNRLFFLISLISL